MRLPRLSSPPSRNEDDIVVHSVGAPMGLPLELFSRILGELPKSMLPVCACVCRAWLFPVRAMLYGRIQVDSLDSLTRLTACLAAHPSVAVLVRVLSLKVVLLDPEAALQLPAMCIERISTAFTAMTSLDSLSLSGLFLVSLLARLSPSLPCLRVLHLLSDFPTQPIPPNQVFSLLSRASSLVNLRIVNLAPLPPNLPRSSLHTSPSLSSLTLIAHAHEPNSFDFLLLAPALTTLTLSAPSALDLFNSISSLPLFDSSSLCELSLHWIEYFSPAHSLPQLPTLDTLTLGSSTPPSKLLISQDLILTIPPSVHTLIFSHCTLSSESFIYLSTITTLNTVFFDHTLGRHDVSIVLASKHFTVVGPDVDYYCRSSSFIR